MCDTEDGEVKTVRITGTGTLNERNENWRATSREGRQSAARRRERWRKALLSRRRKVKDMIQRLNTK